MCGTFSDIMNSAAVWAQVVVFSPNLTDNTVRFWKAPLCHKIASTFITCIFVLFFIVSIFLSIIQRGSYSFWQWQMALSVCAHRSWSRRVNNFLDLKDCRNNNKSKVYFALMSAIYSEWNNIIPVLSCWEKGWHAGQWQRKRISP